jgi:hypothetical protein
MNPRYGTMPTWAKFLLAALALAALAGLVTMSGCASEVRTSGHTWGELGFWTFNSRGEMVRDQTPIPPQVWDQIQRDRLKVAPEEPKRTMSADR